MGRGVEDSTAAPASNQPLMIELRGDRYVRVNSAPVNGEALPLANKATASQPSAAAPATGGSLDPQKFASPRISAARHLSDLPPTILIFRDGHSEQVSDYTIADGILYAQGDFYTDGYWNKKIALAALDLPQTLRVNASRNVDFELPTSPNEVIASF
ncbi:MAG TPA: hypothetical protein VND65_17215 [Candidatus Binatia bacterium]|nr:hypothetical protein [Candidatus Binatia bacterium]